MMKFFSLPFGLMGIVILFSSLRVFAQNSSIDVNHYHFELHLSDETNYIEASAQIKLTALDQMEHITLDLEEFNGDSINPAGMEVAEASWNGQAISWTHSNRKINLHQPLSSNEEGTLTIAYRGVPSDGLIIDQNKYGNRTFFSDHWPNRGSCYLPLNDHPTDKATSSFAIYAPSHYKVVSNGKLQKVTGHSARGIENGHEVAKTAESELSRLCWEWHMRHEIPTKVMVFGVADFDTSSYEPVGQTPLRGWVYPEDAVNGHREYAAATEILKFFEQYIAPYPFDKLDQVQSKTIFGGMENAGCIFYHENSTGGDGSSEDLIAHEIAHQWFGNTASETDWNHLWLSEGFATYLTGFYLEKKYGSEVFHNYMDKAQSRLTQYAKRYPNAVVVPDSTPNLMALLNPYSYQKGAWVLHMLKTELGEEVFLEFIRAYYNEFAFSNASTDDLLQKLPSTNSDILTELLNHYLYQPTIPHIEWTQINKHTLSAQLRGVSNDFKLSSVRYEYELPHSSGEREYGEITLTASPTVFRLQKNTDIATLKWNTDRAYLLGPAVYLKP